MVFENSSLKKESILNAMNIILKNETLCHRLYDYYTLKNLDPIDYSDYIDNYKRAQLMDEQVTNSGKITNLTLYLDYGRTTKIVETTVLGSGAFGFVLKDNTANNVYKIVKVKKDVNSNIINHHIQNIMNEMILSNILNLVKYTAHDGKKVPASPVCTNFYLVDQNETSYQEDNSLLFIIECSELSQLADRMLYDATKEFTDIFMDFLHLVKGIHDAHLYYNHCDVKLNNIMYDTSDHLRFIDFGYSSLYFQTKEGERFMIMSQECSWNDQTSYMYEKDVIQLLLSTFGVYYDDALLNKPSKNLMNNLLYKLTLFKSRRKLNDRFYTSSGHVPDIFEFSYNAKKKIRNNLKDKKDDKHKPVLRWANPDYLLEILMSDKVKNPTIEQQIHRMIKNQLLDTDLTKIVQPPKKTASKSKTSHGGKMARRTRRNRKQL